MLCVRVWYLYCVCGAWQIPAKQCCTKGPVTGQSWLGIEVLHNCNAKYVNNVMSSKQQPQYQPYFFRLQMAARRNTRPIMVTAHIAGLWTNTKTQASNCSVDMVSFSLLSPLSLPLLSSFSSLFVWYSLVLLFLPFIPARTSQITHRFHYFGHSQGGNQGQCKQVLNTFFVVLWQN